MSFGVELTCAKDIAFKQYGRCIRCYKIITVIVDRTIGSGVKRDNKWQHCAVTWKSSTGGVKFYRKGGQKGSETGLKIGGKVPSGGKLVIGQYQGGYGSGYDSSKLMLGCITDLNIWPSEFTSGQINSLANKCFSSSSSGAILLWATVISQPLGGDIVKDCPSTCPS
jgi:hypothetical protein